MSKENDMTISAYNQNIQGYINGTPHDMPIPVKNWIEESFSGLPRRAKILEIGSGFGRDAEYIEQELGYQVERTDAASEFVGYLSAQGYAASQLDVVRDVILKKYDLVLANAVFLHLTRNEAKVACRNVYQALHQTTGKFCLSLLQGEGELMTEPQQDKTGASRYFCYWQPDGVKELLQETGFSKIKIMPHTEPENGATWLHIIAKK